MAGFYAMMALAVLGPVLVYAAIARSEAVARRK
jgi:hypothetical protein